MSCRQSLAKIGVFVLLGLNVGAYYYFWPSNAPLKEEESEPRKVAVVVPARPREFPVGPARSAAPLEEPTKKDQDDPLSRLLEHINKEGPPEGIVVPIPATVDRIEPPPPVPTPVDPVPAVVMPTPPTALPPLKAEPIREESKLPAEAEIAVASALMPRRAEGPWLTTVHALDVNNTLIVAKLRHASPAQSVEFEIRCHRCEETPTGRIEAVGNVTFVGAGIKGSCRRLSIAKDAARLEFRDQVSIALINADKLPRSVLQSDRVVWELPSAGVEVNSVEFRPAGLLLPANGALGAPK